VNGRGVDTTAYWVTVHIWNGKESVIDDGYTALLWIMVSSFSYIWHFERLSASKLSVVLVV
jgi:hypothetical protein